MQTVVKWMWNAHRREGGVRHGKMPVLNVRERIEVKKGVKQCQEEVPEKLVEIVAENREGCGWGGRRMWIGG
jgi:hypothetical protein